MPLITSPGIYPCPYPSGVPAIFHRRSYESVLETEISLTISEFLIYPKHPSLSEAYVAVLRNKFKIIMKKDAMIIVRVPKKIKEDIRRYGIETSKVVRKALDEEIKKRKLEELRNVTDRLGELLSHIPDEKIVKSIRESRESR